MIKVCHIVNLITGQADGVFAHLKMIFKNYDKTKFEHLLIFQGGDLVEKELRILNIKYYKVSGLDKKFSIIVFKEIFKIIKSENPVILHVHLIKPYTIIGLINFFFRKRLIFNYHGSFIQNDYNTTFEKIIYSKLHRMIESFHPTDLVLVPSSQSMDLLKKETNEFKSYKVYYNGFEFGLNDETNQAIKNRIMQLKIEGKRLICFLGRINHEKRSDRAVEIIRSLILDKINLHLFIFGDGEDIDKLKSLIYERKLEQHVTILGFIKKAVSYLRIFDLLLLTSDREGMPFAIWEALGNGVPVVSSDVGGVKEIIEKHNCGYVFENENLNDAVEKILKLLYNDNLRKKMGENGRRIVRDQFNSKNFISTIENSYYSLIGSNLEIK